MNTDFFRVHGPWPGQLAVSSRPRGGEWLADEISKWKRNGIDLVVSLLTREEEKSLELSDEGDAAGRAGIEFLALSIPDREVPTSESELTAVLERVNRGLSSGRNALIHCRQGVGRTGLVAACLLITTGLDPAAAIAKVSAARGVPVPETREQREWIDHYAAVLANSK